jgi:hypothetical protein
MARQTDEMATVFAHPNRDGQLGLAYRQRPQGHTSVDGCPKGQNRSPSRRRANNHVGAEQQDPSTYVGEISGAEHPRRLPSVEAACRHPKAKAT